jgi:hypothetical protein
MFKLWLGLLRVYWIKEKRYSTILLRVQMIEDFGGPKVV